MNTATLITRIFTAGADLVVAAIDFLSSASDRESEDRPLANGSELLGEHNFRTGKLDAGSDSDGWYEND